MNRIRIVELPSCKMAASGYSPDKEPFMEGGALMRFNAWWSEYDKKRADRWFPRDFLMYGREEKALIWYYALPDGAHGGCPYEIVDFEGGLYAAAVAIDSDFDDEQRVYGGIRDWVGESGAFELDERPGHYDLCHVITSQAAAEAMGHSQLEIYVPIRLKP